MAVAVRVESVPDFSAGADPRPVEGVPAYRLGFGAQKGDKVPSDPTIGAPTAGAPVYYTSITAGSDPTWPYSLGGIAFRCMLVTTGNTTTETTFDVYNLPFAAVGGAVTVPMAWGYVTLADPAKTKRATLLVSDGAPVTPVYVSTGVQAPVFTRKTGNRVLLSVPDATATYSIVATFPLSLATAPVFKSIAVTKGTGITTVLDAPSDGLG